MPIRFLGGKPRGGKSLRAAKYLLQELTEGKRHIVTNLALRMDRLQEYVLELGHNVHVESRVTVLDEAQTLEFYRHRGRGLVLNLRDDPIVPIDLGPITVGSPTFAGAYYSRGVLYVIDEIHMFFNSHKWKKVSEAALWYASQHGKLGDDVWCITQSISNVVKAFRDLAQSFHYMRNHDKEKKGIFKAGNHFSEVVFLHAVEPGSEQEPVEGPYKFTLDVDGLASIYDTSAGVGIAGGGQADKGRSAKGVPLWTLWAGLAVLVAVLWVGANYLPEMLSEKAAQAVTPPRATPKKPDSAPAVAAIAERKPTLEPKTPDGNPSAVFVRGVTYTGERANVVLSDGRTLTEDGGSIRRIGRGFVDTDEGRFYFRTPADRGKPEIDKLSKSKAEGEDTRPARVAEPEAASKQTAKVEAVQSVGSNRGLTVVMPPGSVGPSIGPVQPGPR